MHVLHAHFRPPSGADDPGAVVFWAEDSAVPPRVRGSGRKSVRAHPRAAPEAEVVGLLNNLAGPLRPAPDGARILLWLPTTARGPLPSPRLVLEQTEDDADPDESPEGQLELAQWSVDGPRLALADAVALLANLPAVDALPPALRLGDDLRFWQAAARLVLETVAAERLLPGLLPLADGKRWQARWLPVLDDAATATRLMRLADAMPAVCRAEAATPEEASAPAELLEVFLTAAADAVARAWGRDAAPAPGEVLADRWLAALFSDDAKVDAPAAALAHFGAGHAAWLRQLFVAGDRTFAVAFRLQEPAPGSDAAGAWRLFFLLQAKDDPSLLVPAEAVWRARGAVLATLGRRFHRPREKLLAGLAYAARLSSPIRRALAAAKPVAATLTSEEAYDFLREAAPVLEQSGFAVLVPPWWNRSGSRLGARLKLGTRSTSTSGSASDAPSRLGLASLVDFEWEVALGDAALSRDELEALVALKAPLVNIRGQWVPLDPYQLEAAIRFWDQHGLAGQMPLGEALPLALGAADTAAGLPVEAVDCDPALTDWLAQVTGRAPNEWTPPPGLRAMLRPYQVAGVAWLDTLRTSGLGGILADDMGLGKTLQVLALLLTVKMDEGGLPGPVLLVAPTSVVTNWARESERFTPELVVHVRQGPERLSGDEFTSTARASDLVVTSYALLRRDAEDLAAVSWYGLVLDEAQQIKNADTRQARQARALESTFRLALTGTPVENRLAELWSLLHFVAPGYLGSQTAFRQRLAVPIERHADPAALRRLRQLTAPFLLRRLKTDPSVIQDLPDKVETKVYCYLTPEQVTLYEAVVRDALAEVDEAEGIGRRGLVLAMLTRLKQVCNHPAQYLGQLSEGRAGEVDAARSGKLARLVELAEEIVAEGDRVLVFTQYVELGGYLRQLLQRQLGVAVLFLHGGDSPKRRDEMVRRFQDDADGPQIFVLSLKAGGTGLNLTRANHVVHFDRWWNPAVEDQATDRAFRIGQHRNVLVHKYVCLGTLEERIDEMIEHKKALAQSVVGAGEAWLTELTTAELGELVRLRAEAFAG